MADFPTPRSQVQILNDMLDAFLSRSGIKGLRPGGPLLSFLEAASISDARDTQDIFQLLAAIGLRSADEQALDAAGASRGILRQQETASRGNVTIGDSSFTKKATKIYQGTPAPVSGSTTIYVADASTFPSTGSIYIGRGTTDLEGPLAYDTPTQLGSGTYWSLHVPAGTKKFHNIAESVVLAQGGDRVVPSGQIVQTPQTNAQPAITFTTTQSATLLDGEVEVANVPVVCQKTGVDGNVPANTITSITSPAFTGMTVTNPLPFTNGLAKWDNQTYLEAIQRWEQSRTAGTDLAVQTGALGVTTDDQPGTIISANVVHRVGQSPTLYVDDGTGLEEHTSGVAFETLVENANGGEQDIQLNNRPVSRAFVTSTLNSPFTLTSGAVLAIKVGGARSEHAFDPADFRDITNATAYEVAASINGNPNITFKARTIGSGSQVVITARTDTNEKLEVVTPLTGIDANQWLGFPTGEVDSLKLYLNDQLLYKDGVAAAITSAPQSFWAGFTEGETLTLQVDGTPAVTYTFTGLDFVNAGTSYAHVSESNSLQSWASVINAKIPGVTATVMAGALVLTSNLGPSSRASLSISSASTLVQKGMWDRTRLAAVGHGSDYTMDRNLGQVRLAKPLQANDLLTAGSPNTRGYIESSAIGTVTFTSTANAWFVVDGAATTIPTGVTSSASMTLTLAVSSTSPIKRLTATISGSPAYPFTNVQVGDWLIIWDPAFTGGAASYKGTWRVSNVDALGQWVEFDSPAAGSTTSYALTGFVTSGITVVRSSAIPQEVAFTAGTYAPGDFASTISAALTGATAVTYKTNKVRVYTNTYATNGDIALVTVQPDTGNVSPPFTASTDTSSDPQVPVVQSVSQQLGTPAFNFSDVATTPFANVITLAQSITSINGTLNSQLLWARPLPTSATINRFGSNTGDSTTIASNSSGQLTLRHLLNSPTPDDGVNLFNGDRVVPVSTFATGPDDDLSVILDGDPYSKSFAVSLARKTTPNSAVAYGTTIQLKDKDNLDGGGNPQSLAVAFGQSFNFADYAVYMKARAILSKSDSTKSILYRLGWMGPGGNNATVQYGKPTGPATALSVSSIKGSTLDIYVNLPAGADRNVTLAAANKLAVWRANDTATASRVTYVAGFAIATLSRTSSTVTATVTLPTDVTSHQYQIGDTVYVTSTDVNFSSGFKTIASVTSTQFTYTEAGSATTVTPANSYVTWTSTVPDFTVAQVGDYASIPSSTSLAATWQGVYRVESRTKLAFVVQTALLSPTSASWAAINVANAIKFFPVDSSVTGTGTTPPTVNQIAAAVNALPAGTVTATVIGTGTGTVTQSSADDYYQGLVAAAATSLADGVNWIASSSYDSISGNYNLTLKNPTASNLTAPNDWANEDVRLAPQTAANLSTYLSTGAVTGLTFGGGAVSASLRGGHIQLSSQTLGSEGGIQVQGGTGNTWSAEVVGSAAVNGVASVQIKTSAAKGLFGGMWVSCDNQKTTQKQLDWTGSTTLSIDAPTAKVTVGTTGSVWQYSSGVTAASSTGRWIIEKHGDFTAFVLANDDQSAPLIDWSGVQEGDSVVVSPANGTFSAGPAMSVARTALSTLTLLNDGTYLVAGNNDGTTGTQLYNPTTNTFSSTDAVPTGTYAWRASKLADGRVLFTGGIASATTTAVCRIYNWAAAGGSKWSTTTSMAIPREEHTSTLLNDGTVLVTGGNTTGGTAVNSAAIYSPGGPSWTTVAGTMASNRANHTATLMGNGQVLIVGGTDTGVTVAVNSAEAYDPIAVGFTAAPAPGARSNHRAVLLSNGKVLIVGGKDNSGNSLATAQLFDPVSWTWSSAASMGVARRSPALTKLLDGRILVAGGADTAGNPIKSAEIYDPATDSWSFAGALVSGAYSSLVATLSTGDVVVMGGTGAGATNTTATQLFDVDAGIDALNAGTFKVSKVLYDTPNKKWAFWVENPAAVEERTSISSIVFLGKNSILPGDKLTIGSPLLGTSNVGIWTVARLDPTNSAVMYLQGAPSPASPTALGSDVAQFVVTEGQPARIIKQIKYVAPNPTNGAFTDVGFTTADAAPLISSTAGTVLNALDKLEFSTNQYAGVDAYSYDVGLLGELNKIEYGDEADPATYPGIVAAGSTLNIEGPTIKRVELSLSIRINGDFEAIKSRVQSRVAAVVNGTGIGQPIALSSIVAAANEVDGVLSVTIVSPLYTVANDQIVVQPYEKAMVLDLESDILVSQNGA